MTWRFVDEKLTEAGFQQLPLDLLGDIRVRGKNVDIGASEHSPAD